MSIEKLDFHKVTKEQIPYTLISTKVIQNVSCPTALAVWVYLSSLPPEWRVNKEQIRKHFGVGEKTLKGAFSFLNKYHLIEYLVEKNEKGCIEGWTINVLCGEKFLINLSTGAKLTPVDKSTGSKTTRVDIHPCGKVTPIKEINNINNIKSKKEREAVRKKREPLSDNFYPNEQGQQQGHEASQKSGITFDNLLTKFKNIQQSKQKVSMDWEAEWSIFCINEKPSFSTTSNSYKPKEENRPTIQEWAAGHPGWEAFHGKRA